MDAATRVDLGKFLLRFSVGFLMIFHGIAKISKGVDGIASMLASKGLPEFFAYGVYIGEVLAPILLIIGLYVRTSATIIIFTMLTAIFLAHPNDIFALNKMGALQLELVYFYILSCLSIIFLGSGKFAVQKS